MREADALEALYAAEARRRRLANLRQFQDRPTTASDRRNSDDRAGRTDVGRRPGPGPRRQGPLPPGPRHLAGRRRTATPAPEQPRPARRRDQDDPCRLQRPAPPRPLHRRVPPDPLRRLGVQARPRLRHPPPRLDPPGHRRPHPALLHRPRRPGRRPDGRRRHHPRRLPVDGTPLPRV